MTDIRVAVTGVGIVSPIGDSLDAVSSSLRSGRHGIRRMDEWSSCGHMKTQVGAPVSTDITDRFSKKETRTMGRVSVLANAATQDAIADAGLDPDYLGSGFVGLAYGSTHGSSSELERFCSKLFANNDLLGLQATSYLKFMSHTCASNIASYFGIRGRIITTCAACVSGSQAIGYGYEAIKSGQQETMICGGAEELHFTHAVVFDIMFAASSRYNDVPDSTPRPFDARRDGLVVGEGAATLVLERFDLAVARGAQIYAEILGFGTNCDGTHVTNPSASGMAGAMRLSLESSRLTARSIDYVNAHGTGTEQGDIAESLATEEVLGSQVPISSTKGHTGHTLGAAGSIEAVFCLATLRDGFIPPTRTLEEPDSRCAHLCYVTGEAQRATLQRVMSNNFAFGGINTSLIFGVA